ncbi:hypothetical protein F5Y13DRAFT_35124 [Hypoxylon sp. FL1857]|nr:hypothetical protein F5Y13DRAFT_35124 [Hypoxylon sp. FL1857]
MPRVHVELDVAIKPYTVYLALHHRVHDPDGEFHWAIVISLANWSSCVFFHANNPDSFNPALDSWVIEEWPPGQWTPWNSATLLCMFELMTCNTQDLVAEKYAEILSAGQDIMARKSVSSFRQSQTFSCKTFVLDTLAQAIPTVSGQSSADLETHASDAAKWTRDLAISTTGIPMVPGWFKIFKLEMVEPTSAEA